MSSNKHNKAMKYRYQRGQTSVEYILMVAAMIAVMSSIFTLIRQEFIGDGTCPNREASLMCRLTSLWESDNPADFKVFPL